MFGINYYKAGSSTFVIKTKGEKTESKGTDCGFFYNPATTCIAAVPVDFQEVPFTFELQTADFYKVNVQGSVIFRIGSPERTADLLNFALAKDGRSYLAGDPLKVVTDEVVQTVRAVVQNQIASTDLDQAVNSNKTLTRLITRHLQDNNLLTRLAILVVRSGITGIYPSIGTIRAMENLMRQENALAIGEAIDTNETLIVKERNETQNENQNPVMDKNSRLEDRADVSTPFKLWAVGQATDSLESNISQNYTNVIPLHVKRSAPA